MIAGLRNGNIYKVNIGGGDKEKKFESHNEGELWGLAIIDDDHVVTSGDDN